MATATKKLTKKEGQELETLAKVEGISEWENHLVDLCATWEADTEQEPGSIPYEAWAEYYRMTFEGTREQREANLVMVRQAARYRSLWTRA